MASRRTFLRLTAALATLGLAGRSRLSYAEGPPYHLHLPLITAAAAPLPEPWPDASGYLLAAASGSPDQAIRWLVARSHLYTHYDITQIVGAYARIGNEVGIDWFLALAQCAHETGGLTSWWCDRPRRNPAGLGVTGNSREGSPDSPPGPHWAWRDGRWWEGISFPAWDSFAIRAHLGRLLAYALPVGAGSPAQQAMIDEALALRPLSSRNRGVALTITDLNGRWAVPGSEYGQRILDLAGRMRNS
jgi:hypothetical protein